MTTRLEHNAISASPISPVVALAGVGEPNPIRALLVDDDQAYREILSAELSAQGVVVRAFGNGASLLHLLDFAVDADVIILAWNSPQPSGLDLLLQLRRRGVNLPVVFVACRGLPSHESLALDMGTIDFVDKARGVAVLVRRLGRAVVVGNRAADQHADKRIVCGKLAVMPGISRIYWDGVDVGLTHGEYNIVHLLVSNVGRFVTYRAIYDRMHYEGFVAGEGADGYRANVRSAIKRIRNKFRALDPTVDEIENYNGFGYCWKQADTPRAATLLSFPQAQPNHPAPAFVA
jgi:two-component system response regulator ChvI